MTSKSHNIPKCYSYIRFSTPEQIKGNSLERQLELSRTYAREKGLVLDESLTMKDLGLSAYSGEHRTRGALGEFLNLVRTGKVPKNSMLLVESLDRLSREKVMDAFDQFREIIKNGISIVTLSDRMEYKQETLEGNMGQLFMSLTIMGRAYEESLQKSKRLSAVWKNKRENITTKKLTALAPAWLKLDDSRTSFVEVNDRVALVRRIFDMSLRGIGAGSIAKKLNMEQIPAWRSKAGWHPSYIQKILHNRSVMGEYQPHEMNNNRRVPSGEPIPDYFPRIISDEIFFRVQERLIGNRRHGGKNGKLSNLFGGLAKCGYCGSPMQFVKKGTPPKGGSYLVCDSARRGRGCEYQSFRYPEFEDAFLSFCSGLNITDLLTDDAIQRDSIIVGLQGRLAIINDEYLLLERRINTLYETLSQTDNQSVRERTMTEITKLVERQAVIPVEKGTLNQQINELTHKQTSIEQSINGLKELYRHLEAASDQEKVDIRTKLRGEIRQLVERIELFPVGRLPNSDTLKKLYEIEYEHLLSNDGTTSEDDSDKAETRISNYYNSLKDRKNRCFLIRFKNGNYRMITPTPDDPAKFQLSLDKQGNQYTCELGVIDTDT